MARESEQKRSGTASSTRQPRRASTANVSAEDIRRLVAKLKEEETKK